MENCTDTDFMVWVADNKIDPHAYFDPNRMLKFREKLKHESFQIL